MNKLSADVLNRQMDALREFEGSNKDAENQRIPHRVRARKPFPVRITASSPVFPGTPTPARWMWAYEWEEVALILQAEPGEGNENDHNHYTYSTFSSGLAWDMVGLGRAYNRLELSDGPGQPAVGVGVLLENLPGPDVTIETIVQPIGFQMIQGPVVMMTLETTVEGVIVPMFEAMNYVQKNVTCNL